MRITSSRAVMGLALFTGLAALAGCSGSGSGSKPSATIRGIDVGTNTSSPSNPAVGTGAVAVNGAPSFTGQPYGTPSPYLFLQAGNSSFAGTVTSNFVSGAYTNKLPILTNQDGTPAPTSVTMTSPVSVVNLLDGGVYTAYLVGRPDVPNVKPDLSNLDPRFLHPVVLEDNQAAPTAGNATVRVLNAAADAGGIDVSIAGIIPPAFANVGYAATAGASADASIAAGTVTVNILKTGTATVLATGSITFVGGQKYTLVATEPTALPSPAVLNTAPTSATYGIKLVTD